MSLGAEFSCERIRRPHFHKNPVCAFCAFLWLIPLCLLWLNPGFAVVENFFLPDGHGAFELFDGPFAGLEGGVTVWGAGGDYYARLADLDAAGAVHDAQVSDVELLVCFSTETLHLC